MSKILIAEQRELADQVLSITDELVRHALDEAWNDLFDVVDRRRALLDMLQECAAFSGRDSAVEALSAAVTESEQAVARLVARAVADATESFSRSVAYH